MSKKKKRRRANGKTLQTPHDRFVRETLSHKDNAASFLENYLPAEIKNLVDLGSLEIEKDSFIAQDLQDYYSDLLYKVKFCGHDGYVYLLFEHKSYNEKWIALQLLEYILQIWKLKKSQGQKLPVVVPLVLYHGTSQWKIGLKLSDILEYHDTRLREYIPDFRYLLYDLTTRSDAEIYGSAQLKAMLFLLKYRDSELLAQLGKILSLMKNLPDSELGYLQSITIYVLSTTNIEVNQFAQIASQNLSSKGGNIIMTTAERLIAQGIKEGEIKGEIKGKIEGKIEAIESVLEIRFGARGLHLMERIRTLADLEVLDRILTAGKRAPNVDAFETEVQGLI